MTEQEIKKSEYYNRVYLCVENVFYDIICQPFDSFESADKFYKDNYKNEKSTMIPLCKFTPSFMDKYFINNKIKNQFINVIIK